MLVFKMPVHSTSRHITLCRDLFQADRLISLLKKEALRCFKNLSAGLSCFFFCAPQNMSFLANSKESYNFITTYCNMWKKYRIF